VLCAVGTGSVTAHVSENPGLLDYDEQERISEITAVVRLAQAARAFISFGGPFLEDLSIPRALHPKTLGCYSGTFTVNQQLKKLFKKGIFCTPGQSYDTMMRLSERNFENKDTALAVSVKMFNVPGNTIQPEFALADESGTMDFLSFAPMALSTSKDIHSMPKAHFTSACEHAAHQQYDDALTRVVATNSLGFNTTGFRDELLNGLPDYNNPKFYEFTAPGQVAYQFGNTTEPTYKWFWTGPKIPNACLSNGAECISLVGFTKHFAEAFSQTSMELSLWGNLQGKNDSVELDTCWAPTTPELLGKLVLSKTESPYMCEHARFNPWHSPEEHRPLGNVGRARGPVMRAVQEARGALPCNSLEECRSNGESRPSPSRFGLLFSALGAAWRIFPLIRKRFSTKETMDNEVNLMACILVFLPFLLIPACCCCIPLCRQFCKEYEKRKGHEKRDAEAGGLLDAKEGKKEGVLLDE